MDKDRKSALDVLRLSEAERQELLFELTAESVGYRGVDARCSNRWSYHDAEGIIVKLLHPGGSTSCVLTHCRNISSDGIGLLHGSYVHPETIAEMALKRVTGDYVRIRGKVVRCRHLNGRVHEVGVLFDQEINPTQFIAERDARASKQDREVGIGGTITYVGEASDGQLLQYQLRTLNASFKIEDDPENMTDQPTDGDCALVLVDDFVDAGDIISKLRASGYFNPILAMTCDDRKGSIDALRATGADDVLVKPIDGGELLDIIRRQCRVEADALVSDLWSDEDARPVVTQFLESLDSVIQSLREALVDDEVEKLTELAMNLKGKSGSYGFGSLSEEAQGFLTALESGDQQGLVVRYRRLAQLCVRARMNLEGDENQAA